MYVQDIWLHSECGKLQKRKHYVSAAYPQLLLPLLPWLLPLELLHHKSKGSQNISPSRLVVLSNASTVDLEHTLCKRCALLIVHAGC
jgi:hypothetical protein